MRELYYLTDEQRATPDLDGPRSTCRRHVADGGMAGRLGRKSGQGVYDHSAK